MAICTYCDQDMTTADGFPRPDGLDVDFPCQCFGPLRPETLPPGLALLRMSFDGYARAHVPPGRDDLPLSLFAPLDRFARRVRAEGTGDPLVRLRRPKAVGAGGAAVSSPPAAGRSSTLTPSGSDTRSPPRGTLASRLAC